MGDRYGQNLTDNTIPTDAYECRKIIHTQTITNEDLTLLRLADGHDRHAAYMSYIKMTMKGFVDRVTSGSIERMYAMKFVGFTTTSESSSDSFSMCCFFNQPKRAIAFGTYFFKVSTDVREISFVKMRKRSRKHMPASSSSRVSSASQTSLQCNHDVQRVVR